MTMNASRNDNDMSIMQAMPVRVHNDSDIANSIDVSTTQQEHNISIDKEVYAKKNYQGHYMQASTEQFHQLNRNQMLTSQETCKQPKNNFTTSKEKDYRS